MGAITLAKLLKALLRPKYLPVSVGATFLLMLLLRVGPNTDPPIVAGIMAIMSHTIPKIPLALSGGNATLDFAPVLPANSACMAACE